MILHSETRWKIGCDTKEFALFWRYSVKIEAFAFFYMESIIEILEQQRRKTDDILAASIVTPLLGPIFFPYTIYSMRPSAILIICNDIILNKRTSIIEFGSGLSTLLFARLIAMLQSEARIVSIDHNEDCLEILRSYLLREKLDHYVTLIHAPLNPCSLTSNILEWYNLQSMSNIVHSRFDCAIIDGPPAHKPDDLFVRSPALPFLRNNLARNFSLFLDDIDRHGERRILAEWEQILGHKAMILTETLGAFIKGFSFTPMIR